MRPGGLAICIATPVAVCVALVAIFINFMQGNLLSEPSTWVAIFAFFSITLFCREILKEARNEGWRGTAWKCIALGTVIGIAVVLKYFVEMNLAR